LRLEAASGGKSDAGEADEGEGGRFGNLTFYCGDNWIVGTQDGVVVGFEACGCAVVVEHHLIEDGALGTGEVEEGVLFAFVLAGVGIAAVGGRKCRENLAGGESLNQIAVVEEAEFVLVIASLPVEAKEVDVLAEIEGVGSGLALRTDGDVEGLVGTAPGVGV